MVFRLDNGLLVLINLIPPDKNIVVKIAENNAKTKKIYPPGLNVIATKASISIRMV